MEEVLLAEVTSRQGIAAAVARLRDFLTGPDCGNDSGLLACKEALVLYAGHQKLLSFIGSAMSCLQAPPVGDGRDEEREAASTSLLRMAYQTCLFPHLASDSSFVRPAKPALVAEALAAYIASEAEELLDTHYESALSRPSCADARLFHFSVETSSQLAFVLRQAARLRSRRRDALVTVGGMALDALEGDPASRAAALGAADLLILGEAEDALLSILDLGDRQGGGKAAWLEAARRVGGCRSQDSWIPRLPFSGFAASGCPDFTGYGPGSLSGRDCVFPLQFSRSPGLGVDPESTEAGTRSAFPRIKAPEALVGEMEALMELHKARRFRLLDASIPLSLLPRLAEAILCRGLYLEYESLCGHPYEMRESEARALRLSGCKRLTFCLDPGSAWVRELLWHGKRLEALESSLACLGRTGIETRIHCAESGPWPAKAAEEAKALAKLIAARLGPLGRPLAGRFPLQAEEAERPRQGIEAPAHFSAYGEDDLSFLFGVEPALHRVNEFLAIRDFRGGGKDELRILVDFRGGRHFILESGS
jgi:hypothetical protein